MLAGVALVVFVFLELHQRVPMLDLSLFRNSTFAGANVVILLVALAMLGVFFFVSLYMQQVLHYSPIQAGATFLPMTLLITFVAPAAGRISDRVGSRWLMGAGMTLVAGSLIIFSRLGTGSDFWSILPGLLIGGTGMAMTMTPSTAAALRSVSVDKAGVGSAVLNTMRQVGASLGIAIIGAIIAHEEAISLKAGHPHPVAFVDGLQRALEIASVIALGGAIVAIATVRTHRRAEAPSAVEAAA